MTASTSVIVNLISSWIPPSACALSFSLLRVSSDFDGDRSFFVLVLSSAGGGVWDFEGTLQTKPSDARVLFGVADGDVPFPGGEGWCLTTRAGEVWHYANACDVQSGGTLIELRLELGA